MENENKTSAVASDTTQVRLNFVEFDEKSLIVMEDLKKEIDRLRGKYKNNKHQLARLFKNVGNVSECFIKNNTNGVYYQCVEVAAIAICLAIEGDKSFQYNAENFLRHKSV